MTATNPLEKMLLSLNADIDVRGWDQPDHFYAVLGTPEDPYLQHITSAAVDPCETLKKIYAEKTLPQGAIGMVTVSEVWRHLTFDEAKAKFPEAIKHMREKLTIVIEMVAKLSGDDSRLNMTEEEFEAELEVGYNKMVGAFPPAEVPGELRSEMRILSVRMNDDPITTVTVVHDRGQEPTISREGEDGPPYAVAPGGRIHVYMDKVLQGRDPAEADVEFMMKRQARNLPTLGFGTN